jgi:hypothetical protein
MPLSCFLSSARGDGPLCHLCSHLRTGNTSTPLHLRRWSHYNKWRHPDRGRARSNHSRKPRGITPNPTTAARTHIPTSATSGSGGHATSPSALPWGGGSPPNTEILDPIVDDDEWGCESPASWHNSRMPPPRPSRRPTSSMVTGSSSSPSSITASIVSWSVSR